MNRIKLLMLLLAMFVLPLTMEAQTPVNGETTADVVARSLKNRKSKKDVTVTIPKSGRRQEAEKEKQLLEKATERDVVYIFGVGMNFNDTTIYVSEIQPIKYIKLQKKTKFLPFRSSFSLQFKTYLEGTLGLSKETTSIFYDTKEKKASKYLSKLKKRYLEKEKIRIVVVDTDKFQFKKPDYDNVAM